MHRVHRKNDPRCQSNISQNRTLPRAVQPTNKEDLLDKHITESKLPLIRRKPTLSDGNCWYDAIADQMDLLGIPGNAVDHLKLRAEVCKAMPSFPQASDWIKNLFETYENI